MNWKLILIAGISFVSTILLAGCQYVGRNPTINPSPASLSQLETVLNEDDPSIAAELEQLEKAAVFVDEALNDRPIEIVE